MRNIPVIFETTSLLGSAALPIMLLSVGANIELRELKFEILPAIISIILKLAIFPLIVYLVASYLKLSQLEMIVAVIFASVPTAVSSFALARQLGGETKLMARIISIQVALSFITIPLVLVIIV
jgi:predicted permease